MNPVLPFGEWPSPLDPAAAAAGAVRFDGVGFGTDEWGAPVLRWLEVRPDEGGRGVVCRVPLDGDAAFVGSIADEGPEESSYRSSVNEYGGGSWWQDAARVFAVDGPTQAVVELRGARAVAVTPAASGRSIRHAAGVVTPDGRWIVCERERHGAAAPGADEPVNELAVIAVPDPAVPEEGAVLVGGADFVAAPTLSPSGEELAWLQWDHPDLPWDAAEVWAGRLVLPADGPPRLQGARRVAGGRGDARAAALGRPVSVCLPVWSPDGELWWCDDAADRWHLHRAGRAGLPEEAAGDGTSPVFDRVEEVGEPRWVSGGSRYGFSDDGRVVFAATTEGMDSLWVGDPATGACEPLGDPGITHVEHVAVHGRRVALVAGGVRVPTTVWLLELDGGGTADVRRAAAVVPAGDVSVPEHVTFPTTGGEPGAVAHGLLYPPTSSTAEGPAGAAPPLVVRIHGGPTAAARAELSSSVQFWTTRGFAVLEVNYRGSTGYGRRFRDLLRGGWGVLDVADCAAAVQWLAAEGRVDPGRCVIRGGSAGGFTALAALCGPDDGSDDRAGGFAAACSLYGVTDLRTLAEDTHKFESRYLDGLVGELPAEAERYRVRSPLTNVDRIRVPVLLLQGAEDLVVPLSQAEVLSEALAARSVPHALVVFPGEGHGFRRVETIVEALESEFAFYGQVLGFTPHDVARRLTLRR
ncbi:MAG: prolyl oligopeptidase family serine peptidase [Microthrixaceae bacterium]